MQHFMEGCGQNGPIIPYRLSKISSGGDSVFIRSHYIIKDDFAVSGVQIINNKDYDGAKADLWSCGVILFVLMGGYHSFEDSKFHASL